jgi:hypothetical protein
MESHLFACESVFMAREVRVCSYFMDGVVVVNLLLCTIHVMRSLSM